MTGSPKTEAADEDWSAACSDDEIPENLTKGQWEPQPDVIVKMFNTLKQGGVLELEWQCPGRRAPSPAQDDLFPESEELVESKPEESSDFEFKDEMALPLFTPRRTGDGCPKGSAKKKTTNFHNVLLNIQRHRKLDEMEMQASNSTPYEQNLK